jgi:hypothetical protein
MAPCAGSLRAETFKRNLQTETVTLKPDHLIPGSKRIHMTDVAAHRSNGVTPRKAANITP